MSELTFEHINLNQVDPNASSVPDGPYNFQVAGIYPKTYTVKSGENVGSTGNYVSVRFAITGDDRYTGRSTFETFFPNKASAVMFRKIMDATGIVQGDGQSIEEWLRELQTSGAAFASSLQMREDKQKDGSTKPTQHLNLWEVAPSNL